MAQATEAQLRHKVATQAQQIQVMEAETHRLRERLAKELSERDAHQKLRERQVFAEVHQRAARAHSATDARSLEMISVYETQRQKLQAEVEQLRKHVSRLVEEPQRQAAEKELEAQAGVLASAHTFHVQQQRFHERLQAELANLHRKERQQDETQHLLQTRLQELQARLSEAPTPSGSAVAGF